MRELMIKPTLYRYDTAAAFAEAFGLGPGDLVITNEYIYKPYFGALDLKCDVLFQEKYGQGEPSDDMAEAMYRDIKDHHRRIIAVGGGTVIDISKLFALKDPSPILELYDGVRPAVKEKELVLVPTTCGTGSEVTNIAILALNSRGTKKGLAADAMYADSAVLVPELLSGLPFRFFATSSIDALIHAVESSLSPNGNETTRLFGYRAAEMILRGYQKIAANGPNARIPLLGDFLLASTYAGIAFGNAGCAAVHALSYPLGAKYHVAHGESNYALFDGVMRSYLELDRGGEMAALSAHLAGPLECSPEPEAVFAALDSLLSTLMQKKALREYGVTEEDLTEFTDSVLLNQSRLMANNFAPLDRDRIYRIYQALF